MMRQHLLSLLVVFGLLLAVAPAAAGSVVIDEDLSSWIDTGGSGDVYSKSQCSGAHASYSKIVVLDISQAQTLNYVVVEKSGGSSLPDGRTAAEYTLNGETKPCAIDVQTSRNILGQVQKTRITIWLYYWDIGTLSGCQTISLNRTLWTTSGMSRSRDTGGSNICVHGSTGDSYYPYPAGQYSVTYSSGIQWNNYLKVSEEFGSSYKIDLQREFGGTGYFSTISATNSDGTQTFSNSGNTDLSTYVLKSDAAKISVVSPTKTHEFPLSSGSTPETPGDDDQVFSLSLDRTEAALYEPIQATVSPTTSAAYDCVVWNQDSYHLHDEIQYRNIDDTWHETKYNSTTESYDHIPTDADPLSQEFSFPDEGQGKISVRVYDLATKQKLADLSEYVQVSGESSVYFPLMVRIYTNSGSALLDVHCVIENLDTGETTEKTIQKNYFGEILQLQATDHYKITVSKEGYESRTWGDINSQTTEITAYLPELADPSNPDQIRIFFSVYDLDGQPISGATVQVSGLPVAVTNNQGRVEIQATANTTYQYTVSKSGYVGASGSLTTLDTSFQKLVHLTAGDANPTVPPAPGHTVPKPDMSNEEKAQSIIDFLYDAGPIIAVLAVFATVSGLMKMMSPGGGRRR